MDHTTILLHFSSEFIFPVLLLLRPCSTRAQTSQLPDDGSLGGICDPCSACMNLATRSFFPGLQPHGPLGLWICQVLSFSRAFYSSRCLECLLSQVSQLNWVTYLSTSTIILTHGCMHFFFTAPSTPCNHKCVCVIIGLSCPSLLNRL